MYLQSLLILFLPLHSGVGTVDYWSVDYDKGMIASVSFINRLLKNFNISICI